MITVRGDRVSERVWVYAFSGVGEPNYCMQSVVIALRRVMLSEVPSVAMDGYSVYKNDSILPNEILASRIELVPMTASTVVSDLCDFPTCDCHVNGQVNHDGCEKCTIRRRLYIHNTTGDIFKVRTSSILPPPDASPNSKFHPVHPNIILVSVNDGSCIDLELCYRKGIPEYHAKWSVASVNYSIVSKDMQYTLTILGNGAMPPPQILTSALTVLQDKFVSLRSQLLDLLPT